MQLVFAVSSKQALVIHRVALTLQAHKQPTGTMPQTDRNVATKYFEQHKRIYKIKEDHKRVYLSKTKDNRHATSGL